MLPLPNSYPHNNTYRMVHFVQKEPSEMERITETLADALAAGRDAIDAIYTLPHCGPSELDQQIDDLDHQLEANQLLSDEFRRTAMILLIHLPEIEVAAEDMETRDRAINQLHNANNMAQRVADLVGAEVQIQALRRNHI
ncbi:hypothetical protein C0081_07360 [Cohaesibacter celericrescens]|uniref:Uncharacterized protein n=2 Tax=Cohaesibacter celericrescens TaxID=2067669 RepID=A0A2N5XTT9_9HYPH|nr:hypothetical protein C0081_07360 [Cohaesibacter celericrescens]